ncbi:MAG: porin [Planctomycetota bacterium]|nr:porin [Planctomycetota bacterium]
MRKHLILALGLVLAVALAAPAQADDDLRATIRDEISKWSEANDDNTFKVHWHNGLMLTSKNVRMRIGGRMHIDHWFVDDDDFVANGFNDEDYESGVEWRRLRLKNSGVLYDHVEWSLSVDFQEPDEPELRDAYIGLVNLRECFGCAFPNIRVGHQKVPFSLAYLTDSNCRQFMEMPAAVETFIYEPRRWGITIHDSFMGGQLNYAFMYFLTEDVEREQQFEFDNDESDDDGYGFAGRITYTPWYDCECSCRRLHVGAGFMAWEDITQTDFDRDGYSRVGNTPNLINADVPAEGFFAWNVELALIYGPFSLQGEYISVDVDAPASGDPTFTSWYAQAGYWLTGECRGYSRGVHTCTPPCCNFLDNDCCCYGGLEVAVRYDFVDLNDGAINGGELTNFVVGINWHLNPNARVMINWFSTSAESSINQRIGFDESYTGVGVRLQVNW